MPPRGYFLSQSDRQNLIERKGGKGGHTTQAPKARRRRNPGGTGKSTSVVTFLVKVAIPGATSAPDTAELTPVTFLATPYKVKTDANDQNAKKVPGVVDSIRVACDYQDGTPAPQAGHAYIGKGLKVSGGVYAKHPFKDLDPPVTIELISLDCNQVSWNGQGEEE